MGHDHAHSGDDGHGHGHGQGHGHAPASFGRAFAVGISLNLIFVVVETIYGVTAGSVALISDAAHNLTDVLGLALAWAAVLFARRKPSDRHTYDVHIWAMSTTETALTAHLVMEGGSCHQTFLAEVGHELDSRSQIHHTTLQVEAPGSPHSCRQAPGDVV